MIITRRFAVLLCSFSLAGSAAAATITVHARGRLLTMTNPALRTKSQSFDIVADDWGANDRCKSTEKQTLSIASGPGGLDAGCQVDMGRSHSTPITTGCPEHFGQAGKGWGLVVNKCITHSGGEEASHTLDEANGTLTSKVTVCRKKGGTARGFYKAKHELYIKCPTWEDWTQQYGPFTISTLSGWRPVAFINRPAGVQNFSYTITVDPPSAVLQFGLFQGHPDQSSDSGQHLWTKWNATTDVQITGIEVTQGIQNLANEMPLVTRRRTIVRAYVRSANDAVNGVGATLAAWRGSTLLGPPIAAENTAAIRTNGGTRTKLDDSFWFQVPPSWRDTPGDVRFVVTVDPANALPEFDETNNTRTAEVKFQRGSEVVITGVPFHLHRDADRDKEVLTYWQSDQTFWPIAGNLFRLHPAWGVLLQDCGNPVQYPDGHDAFGREWDMTLDGARTLVLFRVAWTRMKSGCGSHVQHWVGLIHPGVNTAGRAGVAYANRKSSWVHMLYQRDEHTPWAVRKGDTFAHELGHNLGLDHAKCAGNEKDVDENYPHTDPCRIAEGDDGYYGMDVYYERWGLPEPIVISNNPNASPPHAGFPFMGYQNPRWADPYSYCLMLNSYGIDCDELSMRKRAAPLLTMERDAAVPRVDRRPRNGYLTVGGIYNVAERTIEELRIAHTATVSVNALNNPKVLRAPSSDRPPLVIAQLDAAKREIATQQVDVLLADGSDDFVPFIETMALAPEAKGVRVRVGQLILAERMASKNRPAVRLAMRPDVVLQPKTQIVWSTRDPDGGPVTVSLLYSPDRGTPWRPVAADLTGWSYVLPDTTRLPGSQTGVLRAEVNDGFYTGVFDLPVRVPTSPPVPVILQQDALYLDFGRTLILDGAATDIDEGAITDPTQFRWRSDRDGALGTGRELFTRRLSRGVHRITLEVSDAQSRTAATSITVYVGVPVPISHRPNV